MNLKEAEVFLKEVNEIYKQIPKKEKTFMQIAGYPHYENACSNILAFYLNPNEEHKLNDIVLTTKRKKKLILKYLSQICQF